MKIRDLLEALTAADSFKQALQTKKSSETPPSKVNSFKQGFKQGFQNTSDLQKKIKYSKAARSLSKFANWAKSGNKSPSKR